MNSRKLEEKYEFLALLAPVLLELLGSVFVHGGGARLVRREDHRCAALAAFIIAIGNLSLQILNN